MRSGDTITFTAEVIETKSRKAASGDKIISIKLETDEEQALALQQFIASEPVVVEVRGCE